MSIPMVEKRSRSGQKSADCIYDSLFGYDQGVMGGLLTLGSFVRQPLSNVVFAVIA